MSTKKTRLKLAKKDACRYGHRYIWTVSEFNVSTRAAVPSGANSTSAQLYISSPISSHAGTPARPEDDDDDDRGNQFGDLERPHPPAPDGSGETADLLAQFLRQGGQGGQSVQGLPNATFAPAPIPVALQRVAPTPDPQSVAGTRRNRSAFEFDVYARPDYDGLVTQLARRRRLNPDSEQELHQFSRQDIVPQIISVFSAQLEIMEYLARQQSVSEYKVPDDLKTNVSTYATATILSPKSTAYLKGNVECVMASLRARGIAMPAADDVARSNIVKSYVAGVLTDKRCKLKAVIARTLLLADTETSAAHSTAAPSTATTPTADASAASSAAPVATVSGLAKKKVGRKGAEYKQMDVGTLCATIVTKMTPNKSSTTVRITLDIYHRVAFLRRCLESLGNTENFWERVDNRLQQASNKHNTPALFEKYFKDCYTADVAKHGEPKRGGFVMRNTLEAWQVTVEEQSKQASSASTSSTGT